MRKEFLDKLSAAEYIGVSLQTLDRIVKDGALPFYRIRGRVKFSVSDIDEYIESCRCRMCPVEAPKKAKPNKTVYGSGRCAYVPGMKVV
ncbi:MAG: helix-turn-helix domain-containing protein [Clostridiales bacterium]|nr:helix-turn-helix domain-containing protein [Clostridiales bacterium]